MEVQVKQETKKWRRYKPNIPTKLNIKSLSGPIG